MPVAGGPLGIDHPLSLDESGIWARKYQTDLELGVVATEIGGALWLGDEQPLNTAGVIRGSGPWRRSRSTTPWRG